MSLFWATAVAVLLLLAACLVSFVKLRNALTGRINARRTQPKRGKPGEAISLHGFFNRVGSLASSPSPFTAKVEALLRFNGMQYKTETSDFVGSPSGRLPWLKHGEDVVSDSRFIAKYLFSTYPELQKHEPSDPVDAARALSIQRLCEQHMYFTSLYHYVMPATAVRDMTRYFDLPYVVAYVIALAWKVGRRTQLRYQGTLVNSEEDINIIIDEDNAALSAFLGSKDYFFGDQPSLTDACVFGFLEPTIHAAKATSYLAISLHRHPNLLQFVERIRQQYYADKLGKLGKGQGKAQ